MTVLIISHSRKTMERWILIILLACNLAALKTVDFHNLHAIDCLLLVTMVILVVVNLYGWLVKKHEGR